MKKILTFLMVWVAVSLFMIGFFAFVSWGESPATWEPHNRFVVAVIYSVFSIGSGLLVATNPKER